MRNPVEKANRARFASFVCQTQWTEPDLLSQSTQNFAGVVQRLVQKEKQVLQLQTELDRLKAQHPGDSREADERAKRERDRAKWSSLTDEIAKLKSRV
jgi:diaphanous 1